MKFRDYIRIPRSSWPGIVLIVVAVVAATAAYTFTQAKVYVADARGFVSTAPTEEPSPGTLEERDAFAKSRAASYVGLAHSEATATEVKQQLGLADDASDLLDRVSVEQPADTVLIDVTTEADTARDAQALADAWIAALARQVAQIEDPTDQGQPGTPVVVPVESAALPEAPVSPRVERNLALGLLLGLLLGIAYAIARNVLDRRLRTPGDVESRFDVNVVGVVPKASVLGRRASARARLAVGSRGNDAGAGVSEAFRKLRTNLTYMDVDHPPVVIVVTSPRPGDGKSTVAGNLAAAIAVSGQRVVLVDADLRRPTQATSLGLLEGAGLTDVLVGRVHPRETLQQSIEHENLLVMAAGRTPPNPSELLGSQAMKTLVDKLAETAMVILDAPPLLAVTDAAVLTANADGALVVISAGQTNDRALRVSLDNLEDVHGRALGVIVNKIPQRGSDSSYYYSRDYASNRPRGGGGGSSADRHSPSGWVRRPPTVRKQRASPEDAPQSGVQL